MCNSQCVSTGIYHRLHYPTVSLSFLDDTGNIIDVPSQRHAKSTLSSVTASMGTFVLLYTICMDCTSFVNYIACTAKCVDSKVQYVCVYLH